MLRGGGWNNNDNNLRVANRNNNNPTNQNNNIGFRCAAPPGQFLEGQVRQAAAFGCSIYGLALSPREKIPGLFLVGQPTKDEPVPPGVVAIQTRKTAPGFSEAQGGVTFSLISSIPLRIVFLSIPVISAMRAIPPCPNCGA